MTTKTEAALITQPPDVATMLTELNLMMMKGKKR